MIRGLVSRHPAAVAGTLLTALGGVLLWPSIAPGRTVVPADILTVVTPWRVVAGGTDVHNTIYSDAAFQFFPWLDFLSDALHDGHLPRWNPSILGGVPVTPNGYVSAYYPPYWVAALASPFTTYNFVVLLHLWIGAFGMYAWARVLGARWSSSLTAGVLTFGAAFWVHWSLHLGHLVGMAWVPAVLALTHRVVSRPTRRNVVLLAGVVGLWWLGGNPQYVYYGTIATGVYAVIQIAASARAARALVCFVLSFGLGAALAAPVLLPTLRVGDSILRTRETEDDVAGTRLTTKQSIRLVVADATGNNADGVAYGGSDESRMNSPFVGLTALLLAVGGVAAAVSREARRRYGPLVVCAGAVLALGFLELPNRLLHGIAPGYDRFRIAARWLAVFPAFVLPLAAVGLDAMLRGRAAPRRVALGAACLFTIWTVRWFDGVRGDPSAPLEYLRERAYLAVIGLAVVACVIALSDRWPRVIPVVVLMVAVVEVALHTPRWYPGVRVDTAYPAVEVAEIAARRGGRLVRAGPRTATPTFTPDVPMAYGLRDADGQAVLFPRDYDRYRRLIDDHGHFALELNTAPPISDVASLGSPLLDALDVRTIVAESNVTIPTRFRAVGRGEPRVYARDAVGDAVLVREARPATHSQMWRAIARPSWDPRATAAVVGLRAPTVGRGGTVTRVPQPGPNGETWDVVSPDGGFLRVSGRWDDGWRASIDGTSVEVLRADGIFRGVVVPPGAHRVAFSYRSPAEAAGRALGLGALAVLALGALPADRLRRRRRHRQL